MYKRQDEWRRQCVVAVQRVRGPDVSHVTVLDQLGTLSLDAMLSSIHAVNIAPLWAPPNP